MKDKILFVTKGGDTCDEGFSYVLELAKTLNTGIEVLIISPAQMTAHFEDSMAAAAFAEEGDLKTAKEIIESEQNACRKNLEEKINGLVRSSKDMDVELLCSLSEGDVATAVKEYLKSGPSIDLVLLSPSLSADKKSLDIRKLIKNVSKPIVQILRPLTAEI